MNEKHEKTQAVEPVERDELSEDDLEQVSGGSLFGFLSNLFGNTPSVNTQVGNGGFFARR